MDTLVAERVSAYLGARPVFRPAPEALLATLLDGTPELHARQEELARRGRGATRPPAPLGIAPLFSEPLLVAGEGYDWIVVHAAADPLVAHRDGFPVPRAVLAELDGLARAGVAFDTLYLAHQIAPGAYRAGDPLTAELLAPPASAVALRGARRLGLAAAWALLVAALPLALGGVVSGVPAAIMGDEPGLDPVLFGVVTAPGRPLRAGEPAAWFGLTHWAYDAEATP